MNENYKIRIRNLSMTWTLTSLFNYEPGKFIHGGLARARVNLEIPEFSLPSPPALLFDSVFQFPISRNSLVASAVGRFDRPYRVAICHGSLTIGVLTNVVVTRKAAPVRRKRRTLSALLALASLRQVNDVKLATIIKLQCRPPAANYRGPHRY